MKLKKVTAMAMTAVLALGMLAGCGKGDSKDTAKSDAGSKDTKQEAEGDVTTITYWGWDTNWYEPMFEKFMEENPDIKIEATNVAYSDYFTKIQQAIASGSELPTMVQQSCTLIANYKELGVFEDLTSDPYNVDPDIFFDFIKDRAMTEDGQLIGIEQSVSPSAIAYKRDLAKEYFGTDDPEELAALFQSTDDYITKGKEVNEKSGGDAYLFHSSGAVAE